MEIIIKLLKEREKIKFENYQNNSLKAQIKQITETLLAKI